MSIAEKIQTKLASMTRSEAQLVNVILDDYPISGLGSITEIAKKAKVSTPTVVRMVRKLGFAGYTDFQASLRAELGEVISNPISKRGAWQNDLPEQHILSRYAGNALDNQQSTIDHLDISQFDAVCNLIADQDRSIYISGGRITEAIAQYLYLHMQMIRGNVTVLPVKATWTHHLLDMRRKDVLIVFDVRRYQNDTLQMAKMAHDRGAEVVLFTDEWRSPIHRIASYTFGARISVPSAWDSGLSLVLLTECLIAAVQEAMWETVRKRAQALEAAFDETRLFRKFT